MKYNLLELCDVITKGTTPSTIGFSFERSGVNYIKSEQITSSRKLNYSNKFYISSDAHCKLKRSQLQDKDILISIAGAYLGKLAMIFPDDLPANTNQAVGIIRTKQKLINPNYLFYYLSTDKMRNIISSYNAQSAQPNINLTQLGNIVIDVPSQCIQKHIVDTKCYSSLSKIARIFLSSSAPCNINSRSSCLTFTIAAWISSSVILPESSMPTYLPGTSE